jgi:hypothetical protein
MAGASYSRPASKKLKVVPTAGHIAHVTAEYIQVDTGAVQRPTD